MKTFHCDCNIRSDSAHGGEADMIWNARKYIKLTGEPGAGFRCCSVWRWCCCLAPFPRDPSCQHHAAAVWLCGAYPHRCLLHAGGGRRAGNADLHRGTRTQRALLWHVGRGLLQGGAHAYGSLFPRSGGFFCGAGNGDRPQYLQAAVQRLENREICQLQPDLCVFQ